eukprot:4660081-Alexandrium_andersonii.AAC.1
MQDHKSTIKPAPASNAQPCTHPWPPALINARCRFPHKMPGHQPCANCVPGGKHAATAPASLRSFSKQCVAARALRGRVGVR